MDNKNGDSKRPSTSVAYVRSFDETSKKRSCTSSFFNHKISFITLLFSIILLGCFVMMLLYLNLQPDNQHQWFSRQFSSKADPSTDVDEENPTIAQVLLNIEPKMKDDVLGFIDEDNTQIMWPDLDLIPDTFGKDRVKRQISGNLPDCRGRQKECEIVLKNVRGLTKEVHRRLDRINKELAEHGIVNEADSANVKFRKIFECLQCRNAINHKTEESDDAVVTPGDARQDQAMADLVPYFESRAYDDGENEEKAEFGHGEERSGRVPKAPGQPQIMESTKNNSKIVNNFRITEILKNTTIIEEGEPQQAEPVPQKYTFIQHPQAPEPESHVTRNMQAGVTSPIILPTAETTKTSQQIQFTPQSNWPSVPVCFYGTPSSGAPSAPLFVPSVYRQGSSAAQFLPYGMRPEALDPTPISLWPQMDKQQYASANYQTQPPYQVVNPAAQQQQQQQQQQPPAIPASPFGQGVMMGPDHRSLPYYCAFVPQNYQQQLAQNAPYDAALYQQGFFAKSAAEAKTTYDDSDEKYEVEECSGFWCPPPYKKCIRNDQKCDGRVDCIGAEDEIGCSYEDSYYSRLASAYGGNANNQYGAAAAAKAFENEQTMIAHFEAPVATENPATESPRETTTFAAIIPPMPELFACKRIIQTIPLSKRCDNSYDCEDASDEEDCSCKDYLRLGQPAAICDGHVDCLDGSDEEGCEFCNEDQYHCRRSGGCIPREKRCDKNMDCRFNEDELDCFALTDGNSINLDMDERPHLNLDGVLSRYDNGVWRPSCFKSDFRTEPMRSSAGQKICEYLGFKGVESADEVIVKTSKLAEHQSTKDHQIAYEYPPHFAPAKKSDDKTCYGVRIRCKPILDRKLHVHQQLSSTTTTAPNYLWPWEASIFAGGRYHCSAVLLEHDLLLSSSQCGDSINLNKNYTVAVLGVSSPYIHQFNGPYQQTSEVTDIRPIKHSDASLFRLKTPVNMTRYVQPLYLEKRIFPASPDDTCVALGVNANHERKMMFLRPILDNCPKCHRCYIEKDHSSACWNNGTTPWSGNVVCLSKNGWYPAAVFHDKDESCGFGSKQTLNSIDYLHAHLSEAINEQEKPHEEPACEGVRGSLGECIAWSKVCDGIRDSQDGSDENPEHCQKMKERCESDVLQCKCGKSELRCHDGKCVPKEKFCDGRTDCADGSDEPANCGCVEYLGLTRPRLVCDGVRNCYDKSDENPDRCLCKDSSFKCHRSYINGTTPCVPDDFVCDGQRDCPHGEDELDETCWAIKPQIPHVKSNGEVMRRTYGVLQSVCSPEPMTSPHKVIEACRKVGYQSGVLVSGNTMADSQYVPRNDFYMFQLNKLTWMTMRDDKSFGIYTKPEGPCYRLFVHCF